MNKMLEKKIRKYANDLINAGWSKKEAELEAKRCMGDILALFQDKEAMAIMKKFAKEIGK